MAFPDYGSPSPTRPNQGKVPQGGLGQMMQRLLQGGAGPQGPQGGPSGAPPTPAPQPGGFGMPGLPPGMPDPASGAPMIPGVPSMPGPGGPMQGAGMQPGISPEEHAAILEQIKGELMRSISGQSGQQDRIFSASSGLSRYRPMGNPSFPQAGPPAPPLGMPGVPPQDAAFPPGMNPGGLDQWRRTGNPMPGQGLPPRPMPPQIPDTNYGPYQR